MGICISSGGESTLKEPVGATNNDNPKSKVQDVEDIDDDNQLRQPTEENEMRSETSTMSTADETNLLDHVIINDHNYNATIDQPKNNNENEINEQYSEISMENMDPICVSDINSPPIASRNVNSIKLKSDQNNFVTSHNFQDYHRSRLVFQADKTDCLLFKIFSNNKTISDQSVWQYRNYNAWAE